MAVLQTAAFPLRHPAITHRIISILWYITLVISKKYFPLILIFLGIGLVAGIIVAQFIKAQKPTAGLKIETTPPVLVFIDNVSQGNSPFDKLLPPGEVTVKLVPEDGNSFQTKVRLTDRVYTVLKREFDRTTTTSSGETITLVPQPGKSASVTIVTSDPDSASVTIDGEPQGFTPLTLNSISASDHQIGITAPGYKPRTINAKSMDGYILQISAQLVSTGLVPTPTIKVSDSTPSATPKVTTTPPKASSTVKITSTPTGFLRVRSAPNRNSSEVGRVVPGEIYTVLDSLSGWYLIKVELSATSSGWISSEYAQKN
jgi:hypothetical protein